MSRIIVHNVGNHNTMIHLTPAVCLGGVPTSPLNEPIVVNDDHLIEDLEGEAMVLSASRRLTQNGKQNDDS